MLNNINSNFPYIINTNEKYSFSSDNFKILISNKLKDETIPNIDNNNLYYFEKLSWDTTENIFPNEFKNIYDTKIYLGKIYFKDKYHLIDVFSKNNRETLISISNSFNYQKNISVNSSNSNFYNLMKIDNVYDIIGSLKGEQISSTNINNKYTNLYDSNYAKYIYRAARNYQAEIKTVNNHNILVQNEKPFFVPIFSFDTYTEINSKNSEINFVYRNIPVPMKIFKTSSHLSSDMRSIYSYIAIYPEYLIKNYREYMDSMMYIEFKNIDLIDNHIYYSNLNNDKDNWLFPFSQSDRITATINNDYFPGLANLQINKYFF